MQFPRPMIGTLLMLGIALAGCTGNDPAQAKADDPKAPDAIVTDDTGAVSGIVLSDELVPVAGASLALAEDLAIETRSDSEGRFTLNGLEPGKHTVLVQAFGYETQRVFVEVYAGKVSELVVELVPQAVVEPYYVVAAPIQGRFFCGFGTGVVSGPCKVVAFTDPNHPVEQAWGDVSSDERNIFNLPTVIADNATLADDVIAQVIIEVRWTAASAGATILQATIEEATDARSLSNPEYTRAKGESPLRMELIPGKTSLEADFTGDEDGFLIGVFPTATDSTPATAYTAQNFEVWITLFYNAPADSGYTVFVDG